MPEDDEDQSDSSDDSETSSESEVEEPRPQVNLDERRTRRGVYHVAPKGAEDSDSDDEVVVLSPSKKETVEGEIALVAEADPGSELTSLASLSRGASHATLASLSTPSLAGSFSQLSTPAPEPAVSSNTSTSSTSSSPYRSIISTRRQKALQEDGSRASSASSPGLLHLATPPPLTDGLTTPRKSARSASSVTRSTETRRSSRLANPAEPSTPSPTKADKGKGKEEVNIKKEEPEPSRLLRARPSTAQIAPDATAKKQEPPRGPDGKLLPTCATCRNVLPLLYIDAQVVWGGGMETLSKKKREALECPRYVDK
jgi:[histone H4]-N-methyl-L-lysine20 N-methyltransferase